MTIYNNSATLRKINVTYNSFLEYYHDIHSGRKLEWLYHLGHGEIVVHCYDKPYRVYSSTFQMGVLHQFNAADAIPVSDIAKGIAIRSVLRTTGCYLYVD
jgi:cullin 1